MSPVVRTVGCRASQSGVVIFAFNSHSNFQFTIYQKNWSDWSIFYALIFILG